MSPRLAFRKATRDGLLVDIKEFEGLRLLLLAKDMPGGTARAVQVLGVALREINTPSFTWYLEYEPLPRTLSVSRLTDWLERHGFAVGVFDQFGNFRRKVAQPLSSTGGWSRG